MKLRRWGALILAILCCVLRPSWAAEPADPGKESAAAERAQLFIGLLKRRAQKILEAHRAPPPPLFGFSTGVAEGVESNVNLDGERRGDTFTEESASFLFRPQFRPWAKGEFSWSLLNSHFREFTDSNLWMNTWAGMLQIRPHRLLRLDLGAEYGTLNFPRDSDSSFSDQRFKASLSAAQTSWLTHKIGWVYQLREYDTRLARDSGGTRLAGLNREDRRHTGLAELQFRFPKFSARVGGEFYRNFSNDQSNEFYDWEDFRFRGVLTRIFSPQWIGILTASQERKNYQSRTVPAINVAERDNLLTLGGSLIYQWTSRLSVTYSLTYRTQDSNDPRLDFTDWINQLGVTLSF